MTLERYGRFGVAALALGILASSSALAQSPAPAQAPNPAPTPPQAPVKGDVLAPFDAEGVDGSMYHIDYPKGQTTLLLFFLSGCPVCHKMIPEWGRMYEQRRGDSPKIYGVLMDREPPGFFTATQIPFQVLRAPSREFMRSYKVQRAPTAIRIGPGGKVEDSAIGIVDGIKLGELFRP
jgi:peroxiredoxin